MDLGNGMVETVSDTVPEQQGAPYARKIIHIDMDAFFASVEQRDDPSLRGRPVAVGGSRERGVVAAASYEARVYGVRSAMPSVTARRRCPDLVFVKPRFEVYKAVSMQIRAIFAEQTELIEPLSLDEAYLDVTDSLAEDQTATAVAEIIRRRIREVTGLTASAGVSYNKFLAKLASDQRKPDGLFVIRPSQGAGYVAALPVGRFHGVGPATAARMERLGIRTGLDLRERSEAELIRHFGKSGPYYYNIARGIDHRPVRANRIRKSIGAESTFSRDLYTQDELREALVPIAEKVWAACAARQIRGRTMTLKIKYADFHQITRRSTLAVPLQDSDAFHSLALRMLEERPPSAKGIRLLGVSLSSLTDGGEAAAPPQLDLLATVPE